jgi:hypothetical protein
MPPRVFYSFHYDQDSVRASQVRNMGVVEGSRPATDNEWEQVKRGGDAGIKLWIAGQLVGKSCCIVLIGQATAGRKWITYEASEAWNQGKGVVGIYIHNLRDFDGRQSSKGNNPLDHVTFNDSGKRLSAVAKTYDPPYFDSKQVYGYINDNLALWIQEAIRIRRVT